MRSPNNSDARCRVALKMLPGTALIYVIKPAAQRRELDLLSLNLPRTFAQSPYLHMNAPHQSDIGNRETRLFGIPIAGVSPDDAVDIVEKAIINRQKLHIGVVNAAKIVNMGKNPELRDSVLDSDVIFADGMSVVWASKLLGTPLPSRVTGIDLMFGMLARADRANYRVYLLGATDEVLNKVRENIAKEYPGCIVAGFHNGYFSANEEEAIAMDIKESNPDILLVAITSPKKENFLARWAHLIDTPVCHGVGGSFDVYAGKVKRAPELWQKLGLEWLYRVLQEPGRMWKRYLFTNSAFLVLILKERAKIRNDEKYTK